MTATASFPSADFPATAGVRLPQPEGWEPLAAPAPVVTLVRVPKLEGQFQPNVVVTSRRTVGATLEDAAAATLTGLQQSSQWEETGQEYLEALGGRRSFRVEGAFVAENAGTVYQSVLVTVVERGPFVDVMQVVGTSSASQTAEVLPEIRSILQGTVITD